MSEVLIVFATVEGQSRRIAEMLGDHLVRRRHGRTLLDATRPERTHADPAEFDAVFIVAPVHGEKHHAAITHFVRRHAETLTKNAAALISVSLHAASGEAEDQEEMRDYVDLFCSETGWLPREIHYAAGALRFSEFDFFKKWIARRLARSLEMEIKPGEDVEFTDWRALETFADTFMASRVSSPATA